MEQTILKPSPWKLLGYISLSLVFVVIAIFLIRSDTSIVKKILGGYLSIVLFGGGASFFIYKLAANKPTLTLSSEGIFPNFLPQKIQQLVPWTDIKKISTWEQEINTTKARTKQHYLVIYLKNPQKYPFQKYFSKEKAENIAAHFGSYIEGGLKGDLYIPTTLLPNMDKVFKALKKYPVKVE